MSWAYAGMTPAVYLTRVQSAIWTETASPRRAHQSAVHGDSDRPNRAATEGMEVRGSACPRPMRHFVRWLSRSSWSSSWTGCLQCSSRRRTIEGVEKASLPPIRLLREVIIRVRGHKVGFGDHLVMDGLDLDLHRGEVLGFVGASGSRQVGADADDPGPAAQTGGNYRSLRLRYRQVDGSRDALDVGRRWGVLLFQEGALFSSLTWCGKASRSRCASISASLRAALGGLSAARKLALVGLPQDTADKVALRTLRRHDQTRFPGQSLGARPGDRLSRRTDFGT